VKPAVARFYWDQLGNSGRVLDLGCGDGAIGRWKPAQHEVHGLEIDPELVAHVEGYATAAVWDLDDGRPLPFADGQFDAVVAKDILEHLQRPWHTVAEIRRVLRPGGLVLASVICHRGRRLWSDYTHVRGFTERTARRLLEDRNLIVERQWRMGGVPGSARVNLIHLIPSLLAIPVLDWFWTSSYELRARKPDDAMASGTERRPRR
jgi:SAM-dependent methyltransferase